MKNIFFCFCIIFMGAVLIFPKGEGDTTLRFRVIGASDETWAQENKMQVVKAVGELLEKEGFETVLEAQEWIENNISTIEGVSKKTLEQRGDKSEVSAALREEYYESEDVFEKSLVITLGRGEGHNFFTTLFPRVSESLSKALKSERGGYSFTFFKRDRLVEARFKILDFILSFR